MTRRHAVVIAGAGPTGLMLAAELALARVDVAVVERRETQALAGSRAGGLLSRTIEVLDQRGVAERFLSRGQTTQVSSFGAAPLGIVDLPTRHDYALALWQNHIEQIMADWVSELPVTFYRGHEVTDLSADEAAVNVVLSDASSIRADWLVGCDGGRSLVRRRAGIAFPGWEASTSYLIAEADMAEEPPRGLRRDAKGVYAISKLGEGDRVRIVLREDEVRDGPDPTLEDVRAALKTLYGTDFGLHAPTWISRFSDTTRQAETYRNGRVFLAGDAAHIHSPNGGQGLNLGLDLVTESGPQRVFSLMHDARPLLLSLDGPLSVDSPPPSVKRVDADCSGTWELPALGAVAAPSAVLVRPDGYVAWVGQGTTDGLREALAKWFGSDPDETRTP